MPSHPFNDNNEISFEPPLMRIHGTIEAGDMDGIANYEKAFFTETYLKENLNPEMKIIILQNMIAVQIPCFQSS